MLAFDTETNGLDPRKCNPTHIGLYDGNEFEIHTASALIDTNKDSSELIMHNGKFDTLMMWWNHKVWIPWKYDTMLLSQLYDSRVKHKLDTIGELYVGEGKWGDKKVLQAIKKGEFWMLPVDTQEAYLRRDCELTWRLCEYFRTNLSHSLISLYESFDHPVSLALAKIETNGFSINEELLNEYRINLSNRKEALELELRQLFGDINLNSPKQLLPALLRTTGCELKDTSERTLAILGRYDTSVAKLLDYREVSKYLGTYIGTIDKHIWQGKVYPQYHLAGDYHTSTGRSTATGRTSSSNPNLQNQPRATGGPVNIRALFRASEGNVLLAADYSQLELKVIAAMSEERNLLDGDIHQRAADILRVDRTTAKTCNFAKLYNAGRGKLFYTSGGSKHVDTYIKWFEKTFPKAVKWCEDATTKCKEEGRVATYLGRVRYMDRPEVGPNTIIQGSAGDIGKEAICLAHKAGYRALGLIHDEVIVEIPEGELHTAAADIQRIMTDGLVANAEIHEKAQLEVKVKCGSNWGAMKELEHVESRSNC